MNKAEQIICRMNELGLRLGACGTHLVIEGDTHGLTPEDGKHLQDNHEALLAHLCAPRQHVGIMCRNPRKDGTACAKTVTVRRHSGLLAWCQACYADYPKPDDNIVAKPDHVVMPLSSPVVKPKPEEDPAMYVAMDLEHWITGEPHIWADKVTIAGKTFVRLTHARLRWFTERVKRAEAACNAGQLPADAFARIVNAFCPVHEFSRLSFMAHGRKNEDK